MEKNVKSMEKYYELTKSQLMIWMGQKMKPDSPMYNMAIAFNIFGSVDLEVFKQAFADLVGACDAMRTVFEEVDGVPIQKIIENFEYDFDVLDISEKPNALDYFDQWKIEKAKRSFDIESCLFETVLIKINTEHYIWYFNQHHLIIDAWAVSLQYKELLGFYNNITSDREILENTIPLYSEYLLSAKDLCNNKFHIKATEHWKAYVNKLPLPPKFYNNSNPDFHTDSVRSLIVIEKEKADILRRIALSPELRSWTQDLSLFTIFSAILYSYIYRVTHQQKIVIGTPAHNRYTKVFKETPGLFIELFPLLSEIEEEETFTSLIQKVRAETYDFLTYAQPDTSTSELNRSFNIVLNYINVSFTQFQDYPMTSEWIHSDHADPSHHIRLQVHDFNASGNIDLCFDMNTSVFSASQMDDAKLIFQNLLDAFVADKDQLISKVNILGKNNNVEKDIKGFLVNKSNTVLELYNNQLQSTHNDIAIKCKDKEIEYQDLELHSNRLANYLIKNGVSKGDNISIYLQRSPEFVIAVLAILKAGASFTPIPINYPSGRVLSILEDAKSKIILSNSYLAAKLPVKFDQLIELDKEEVFITKEQSSKPKVELLSEDLAYILYTSGSTGKPKGVMINHKSLYNYIVWARDNYLTSSDKIIAPLFTSVGFDLTITSLFLPIITGGTLITYPESELHADLSLFDVLDENLVNFIKLTPSHISMLPAKKYVDLKLDTMIVGGEDFKVRQAEYVLNYLGDSIDIYNEYGPTEATVGCIVHKYNREKDKEKISVPIGTPIVNCNALLLDENMNSIPDGVVGELYLSGEVLALGYLNQKELTEEAFIKDIARDKILYKTGDQAILNSDNIFEYMGRVDAQVKLRGRRVELAEIENTILENNSVDTAIVLLRNQSKEVPEISEHNCTKCGLPSNYPQASFDTDGVCMLCQDFEAYQKKVHKYFKTEKELFNLINSVSKDEKGAYDCISLLSGGKDSTYVLAQLIELGFKPLAFTLDNGYISSEAKLNIDRIVNELDIDHIYGTTEAMDEIFVDSLNRHCNVCDGCFKTIYTLSVQLAIEKKIPFIVTGLSRGQFFETRLTEELFRDKDVNIEKIDEIILDARVAYHQVDDAVKELLDTSLFEDPKTFEKVQFLDYYRYNDVSLDDMLSFLDKKLSWVRPTDTGRSTNCLINQAGIYVHKKERGYSNYAFPYSWDVRLGHKTRDASLEEINEEIDEAEVKKILGEIGYTAQEAEREERELLVAYYTSSKNIEDEIFKDFLAEKLPDYMMPVQYIRIDKLPVNLNGKIDISLLPKPDSVRPILENKYIAPETEFEILVADIWKEVLQIDKIGVRDNFLDIGGDSLSGIRILARINETLELELPVNTIFQYNNIAQLSKYIENTIVSLLESS